MAQKTIAYTSKVERDALIAQEEANGWSVLHDNYVDGWQHGDELSGSLIFDNTPTPPLPPERDWSGEWATAGNDAARINLIAERLGFI